MTITRKAANRDGFGWALAFVVLHPIRCFKVAIRRWTLDSDLVKSDVPADADGVLDQFQVGELIPIKGVHFRVGRIAGGEFPVLLLSPVGPTHGAKLKTMRDYRDAGRAQLGRQMFVRKELNKEVRRAGSSSE